MPNFESATPLPDRDIPEGEEDREAFLEEQKELYTDVDLGPTKPIAEGVQEKYPEHTIPSRAEDGIATIAKQYKVKPYRGGDDDERVIQANREVRWGPLSMAIPGAGLIKKLKGENITHGDISHRNAVEGEVQRGRVEQVQQAIRSRVTSLREEDFDISDDEIEDVVRILSQEPLRSRFGPGEHKTALKEFDELEDEALRSKVEILVGEYRERVLIRERQDFLNLFVEGLTDKITGEIKDSRRDRHESVEHIRYRLRTIQDTWGRRISQAHDGDSYQEALGEISSLPLNMVEYLAEGDPLAIRYPEGEVSPEDVAGGIVSYEDLSHGGDRTLVAINTKEDEVMSISSDEDIYALLRKYEPEEVMVRVISSDKVARLDVKKDALPPQPMFVPNEFGQIALDEYLELDARIRNRDELQAIREAVATNAEEYAANLPGERSAEDFRLSEKKWVEIHMGNTRFGWDLESEEYVQQYIQQAVSAHAGSGQQGN